MQIGDIKEFDGVKRKITGFCMVGFDQYPVTEPYLEPADDEIELETEEAEALDEFGDAEESKELKCQYCGKVYKEIQWLEAHEAKCKENPANMKEGEE